MAKPRSMRESARDFQVKPRPIIRRVLLCCKTECPERIGSPANGGAYASSNLVGTSASVSDPPYGGFFAERGMTNGCEGD